MNRKHLKRHEKPYACTHANCEKKFGSKNDWKRHEGGLHIQLEFWLCGEKAKDKPCGHICQRRETFHKHLQEHGLTASAIDKKCTEYRIGRNFESRYWCGFCRETIKFTKNGELAVSERFDHIDAHFTGKDGGQRRDIKEWKYIEMEPFETFQTILPDTRTLKADSELPVSPGEGHLEDGHSRKRSADSHDGRSSSQSKRTKSSKSQKSGRQGDSLMWICVGLSLRYPFS